MDSLRVCAYAKLNLTLRVVGRREDGYHLLQSLICAVDLADEILLDALPQGIELAAPAELGPRERNLAYRAAQALLGPHGPGVRVVIEKRIPTGAGLGGGSSDAAAALTGVNELLSLNTSPAGLQRIGAGLGADVPFFLGPSPAWVEGIGDQITPVDVPLPAAFLILVPTFRCPTPEVYRAFDALGLPLSPPALPGHLFTAEAQRTQRKSVLELNPNREPVACSPQGSSAISASLRWPTAAVTAFENDLWPAAVHLYPQLVPLRARLTEVSPFGVGMTGSGSGLFAPFPSRAAAEAARGKLRSDVDGELFVAAPMPWGYRIQR